MKFYKYSVILLLTLMVSSCGDDLAELNSNPNTSPTARPQEVLTAGIGYFAISLEGYFNETNALFSQYWAGGPGVALLDHERYFVEPGDFSTEWSFSYLQALSDLDFVVDNGNQARSGVAQILSAFIFQNLVDHYGDIPYSEALKGAIEDGSFLTPKYDDGKSIYDALILSIDEGVDKIVAGAVAGDEIGAEDLIFDGDLAKWSSFANSLKLKLYMRQASSDPSVASAVQALINEGDFIGGTDVVRIPFNGDAGNWNPQYARREQGIKQFYVASNTFVTALEQINDPRLSVLFDPAVNTGTIVGLDQGNVANLDAPEKADFSFPSAVQYGAGNDVILMSGWEVMFLRAEAAMRFGTSDNDVTMFNNAVSAHFDYIGATGAADYLSTEVVYDNSLSDDVKLNLIGIQKWISFCGLQESEGWIESRRFDRPGNNIFTGSGTGLFNIPTRSVLGNDYPSIRLYPQSELSFNPNTPSGRTLTDRVFWDN